MSKIEWTDATWNPLAGCSIVSPACTNCYAMAMAARIERMSPGLEHYQGLTQTVNGKPVWTGKVAIAPEANLLKPLRWKKPRRIFVNSMSDLFHENVPDEWIDRIFAVMALAPQHTFQVLTKRPKRMREYLSRANGRVAQAVYDSAQVNQPLEHLGLTFAPKATPSLSIEAWPLPNVWLGVTAEDQTRADERIPELLATPAAVRFASVEPMLGPVDLIRTPRAGDTWDWLTGERETALAKTTTSRLDWVICGGESGPGARPMHPDWARSLRDQCAAAGVPFFFKQWGEFIPCKTDHDGDRFICIEDGARSPAFDEDTKHPIVTVGNQEMWRVGKSRAGRLLDGREWNEFPGGTK
jgi:protein gp37